MRIALVEDDPAQAQQMAEWLSNASYNPHWFANGQTFMKSFRRESFDLIILDWNLPDTEGISLLRQIRETDPSIGTLFITSRNDENDIVAALEDGADDYLVKPTRHAETLARISSVMRRTYKYNKEDKDVCFAPFTLHRDHFTVDFGDETIQLTSKEFEVACFMFQNHDRLLSRNHILESVWGVSSDLTTRTVDVHISKIRLKLGLKPDRGWRMVSVYKYGYRLESLDGTKG
ncbi:response regulator transcription factor [Pseudomonadota bacterium]